MGGLRRAAAVVEAVFLTIYVTIVVTKTMFEIVGREDELAALHAVPRHPRTWSHSAISAIRSFTVTSRSPKPGDHERGDGVGAMGLCR
jgi:hypothetical protein